MLFTWLVNILQKLGHKNATVGFEIITNYNKDVKFLLIFSL